MPSWKPKTCPCKIYFNRLPFDVTDITHIHMIDACKLHVSILNPAAQHTAVTTHHKAFNGMKEYALIPEDFAILGIDQAKALSRILNRNDVLIAITNYENAQITARNELERIKKLP